MNRILDLYCYLKHISTATPAGSAANTGTGGRPLSSAIAVYDVVTARMLKAKFVGTKIILACKHTSQER
jgi:hypothetical protein